MVTLLASELCVAPEMSLNQAFFTAHYQVAKAAQQLLLILSGGTNQQLANGLLRGRLLCRFECIARDFSNFIVRGKPGTPGTHHQALFFECRQQLGDFLTGARDSDCEVFHRKRCSGGGKQCQQPPFLRVQSTHALAQRFA